MTSKAVVDFYATNPGGTEFKFKPVSWEGTWPKIEADLEAREMEIECLRKVPIKQSATVRAEFTGRTIFRGYVEYRPELNGGRKTIICAGMEKLLDSVVCPNFFYVSGDVDLNTVFADALVDGEVPGLLAIPNSHLPHGWNHSVYDADHQTIKLPGLGTLSRWGNKDIYCCGLAGIKKLSQESVLTNLEALDNTFYRDNSDLYVRVSDSLNGYGWHNNGGLMVEDGFDSSCRLGTIDGGTSALRGDLEINVDTKLGSLIVNLAKGHDKFVHIRDDSGLTYFDILDDEGRGEGEGLFELHEEDCSRFRQLAARDPRCNSLTGIGEGYQYYTAADVDYRGPWVARTFEVEHGFRDSEGFLIGHTDDEFDSMQLDYQWEVGTYRKVDIKTGDFIKIWPDGEQSDVLSCEKIVRQSTGETIITLGAARPRFADSWRALQDITNGFTDKTLWRSSISETQSTTCYPHDPDHAGTDATLSFTVPDNVLSTDLIPRITLEPSISYDSSETVPISQRCSIQIYVDSVEVLPIGCVTVGSSLAAIDITDYITEDSTATVIYKVHFAKECTGTHADYSGHPKLSVSGIINYYKRMAIT